MTDTQRNTMTNTQRKYLMLLVLLVFALLLSACSGDDSASATKPPPAKRGTPYEMCTAYVNASCDRIAACNILMDQCAENFQTSMKCDKATGVSSEYDACMYAVPRAACSKENKAAPVECWGVITYP